MEIGKISKCDSSKFDFILDSIATLYSNPELGKFLTKSNGDYVEISRSGLTILEELIYNSQKKDPFLGVFLNAIKSNNKCSTKTAICFSILLWKRCCNIIGSFESPSQTRQFLNSLKQILNQAIRLAKVDLAIQLTSEDLKE